MRLPPALLSLVLLGGCAGNVADFVGPREGIVQPELTRYGLNLRQSRCVAEELASNLRPRQLRLFTRAAGAVQQGYFEPERLTMRDLLHVASTMSDSEVSIALVRAAASCDATPEIIARRETPPTPPAPAPRPPAWLNLGAAPTGQAIAIDASTIEQNAAHRKAWFRLTDPGQTGPSDNNYLLQVDCSARTINPLARRRQDATGAVAEYREYADNPLAVEGGTVMEIAYLALCT